MFRTISAALLAMLMAAATAQAGLYYSGEQYASLPTQWRGFLLDHRALRNIAVKPKDEGDPSPLRTRYQEEVQRLLRLSDEGKLGADGLADLGALYIRLGENAQ